METLAINADGGTLSGLLAAIVDALFSADGVWRDSIAYDT